MKKDIHPKYFPKSIIRCACGAVFSVGSTKEQMETEICSQCHPFYTGKEKIIDKMGKVEKFKKKLAQKEILSQKKSKKKQGSRVKK
jgi:large subunit ribosomal protein L31